MAASKTTGSKKTKVTVGNYFMVSVGAAKCIAQQTQSVEAVLAYFVLCNYKQNETVASTGGALAVASALGVSRHKATNLLELLRTVSLGEEPAKRAIVAPKEWNTTNLEEQIPEKFGKYEAKVLPPLGEAHFYLDNSFVTAPDGRYKTAVEKIMEIPQSQRLDALLLLMELYENHHLADFGGVDPKLIARNWVKGAEVDLSEHGGNCDCIRFFAMAARTKTLNLSQSIADNIFAGNGKRFTQAMINLRSSGLMYEASVVFSEDPLKGNSEVLYTLYDAELETGLASDALSALRTSELEPDLLAEGHSALKAGFHVYAAPTEEAKVLGVFRLKHLENAADNRHEQSIETKRADRWKEAMENISFDTDEGSTDFDFQFFGCDAVALYQ